MDTTTAPQYTVESLHKKSGETEADTIQRLVNDKARDGWELVEACGDEIRMPSLIFVKQSQASASQYLAEIVPHVKGRDEVEDIRNSLITRHDEGWLVLTVLDSPLSPPVAVYKKHEMKPDESNSHLVILPISILGSTAETVKGEIYQQELHNDCRLRSIMHSGLSPVLIFLSNTGEPRYDYHVEHASLGFFAGHNKKLSDLINARAKEGWKVCGAFEDESLLPCVVFYRESKA